MIRVLGALLLAVLMGGCGPGPTAPSAPPVPRPAAACPPNTHATYPALVSHGMPIAWELVCIADGEN